MPKNKSDDKDEKAVEGAGGKKPRSKKAAVKKKTKVVDSRAKKKAKAGKKRAKKKSASRKKPASVTARKKASARVAGPIVSAEEMRRLVAEAAYYRWLDRGPAGGDADSDWAWAEREVKRRLQARSNDSS